LDLHQGLGKHAGNYNLSSVEVICPDQTEAFRVLGEIFKKLCCPFLGVGVFGGPRFRNERITMLQLGKRRVAIQSVEKARS
jgi:hypothetical protein